MNPTSNSSVVCFARNQKVEAPKLECINTPVGINLFSWLQWKRVHVSHVVNHVLKLRNNIQAILLSISLL